MTRRNAAKMAPPGGAQGASRKRQVNKMEVVSGEKDIRSNGESQIQELSSSEGEAEGLR